MEYEMVIPPFEHGEFENLKKREANKYFEWYMSQVEYRIEILRNYVRNEEANVIFDYSPESLISLWSWYEKKIQIVEKTKEELEEEFRRYPAWMHDEIWT